jgi:MFS family permease
VGLNPTGVVVKICATEISDMSNRTRLFSILSPAFGIGFLMATFLGGELAHPYERLPWWLGGSIEIYKDHPFALPCLTVFVL